MNLFKVICLRHYHPFILYRDPFRMNIAHLQGFSILMDCYCISKTSRAISVGEDATRVVTRIDYDCETDRCVGFCSSFAQQ